MRVEINIPRNLRKAKNFYRKGLDRFTDDLKEWVDSRTPVNKRVLVWDNLRSEIVDRGYELSTKVYNNNDSWYLLPVENWVLWKEFNYNIPSDPDWFSKWVWAWMFKRTRFDMEDKLKDYLLKW